jgi:hypothetical protein
LARGEAEQAVALLESVERESQAADDDATVLDAMLVRAEALTKLGQHDKAVEVLAISRTRTADDVALLPRVHLEQARADFVRGDAAKAQEEVAAGLAVAREYELAYEQSRLLRLDAEIAETLGHSDRKLAAMSAASEIEQQLGIR